MTASTARDLTAAALSALPLPSLGSDSDKDARGSVLVIAGGAQVPGAPVLTGLAALRVGAGKLKLVATPASAMMLGVAVPEAAIVRAPGDPQGELGPAAAEAIAAHLDRCDAVVVGPGMIGEGAHSLAGVIDAAGVSVVLDAGVLSGPVQLPDAKDRKRVLTPHAGEMARLLDCSKDEVAADPAAAALEAARRFSAVAVMKGETTYVADADGTLWRHEGGVVGLGTSGSGDVLAGVIGGLLARGASGLTAAVWGVYLHADAGRRLTRQIGPLGFLAREILDVLPVALEAAGKSPAAEEG